MIFRNFLIVSTGQICGESVKTKILFLIKTYDIFTLFINFLYVTNIFI